MDVVIPPYDELVQHVAELERENSKLRKINKVLIDRVERSMDFQGNAFSLFQTAIVLEGRIRDRTMELEDALHALEKTNRALNTAKEEAETAEMRLAEAIESVSEGFVLWDADDRLVMCNTKYREIWPGLTEVIVPGIPFVALLHHAQALGLFADQDLSVDIALQQRVRYHRQPIGVFVLKLSDGRWVQVSERRTADGGSVAIYMDITAVKLSEQRQREREVAAKSALLQAIFDNISQGISVIDRDRSLVAWNQRFLDLLGIPAEEIHVGQPLRDFINRPEIRCQFLQFGFDPTPAHFDTFGIEQICDDGRVLEIRVGPMPGGGIVSTYTDITERKRSEWALRDSEYRIRLITDAVPALIAYVDSEEHYRFTNKPYEDWFGRPRSEINGRPMRSVLGAELYDGRRHFVEAALSGQRVSFELDLSTARGRLRHATATYVPHFGPDGGVLGFFALIQDITERKRAAEEVREAKEGLERRVAERTMELTSLNLKLKQEVEERRQAEQALNAAKGDAERANMSKTKFIAAASHDLLQPLNAARVFAAALAESRMAERNRNLVHNVVSALNSVDELLSALLDISKFDAGAYTPEISNFCIDSMLLSLVNEHLPQVTARHLTIRCVPSSMVVRSDPVLVCRILRNFLSNAMRYTPFGRILLGCRRRRGGIEVQVWDTGIGIPEDKLGDIFQEFHRLGTDTHGKDRGMGLGLAIVDRILRCLGHQVFVRSQLGKGSVFSVLLPYGSPQESEVPTARFNLPAAVDRLADLSVMVVENDNAELAAMEALLQSWHCQVQVAANTAAALVQLRYSDHAPDVVIADYHLDHDDTGLQTLRTVQALYQHTIAGIVLTADRTDEIQNLVRGAGYHLLNKPLKPARLRSLLAHIHPPDGGQRTSG